jgi:hypothetical protein
MSETSTSYANNIQIAQSVASRRKRVFTCNEIVETRNLSASWAKWSPTTSICL